MKNHPLVILAVVCLGASIAMAIFRCRWGILIPWPVILAPAATLLAIIALIVGVLSVVMFVEEWWQSR